MFLLLFFSFRLSVQKHSWRFVTSVSSSKRWRASRQTETLVTTTAPPVKCVHLEKQHLLWPFQFLTSKLFTKTLKCWVIRVLFNILKETLNLKPQLAFYYVLILMKNDTGWLNQMSLYKRPSILCQSFKMLKNDRVKAVVVKSWKLLLCNQGMILSYNTKTLAPIL